MAVSLHAPDVYMEKIAVGGGLPAGVVDLDRSVADNLARVAKAKDIPVEDLVVCVLERERHEKIINEVRAAGARLYLIGDGDVSAVIATSLSDNPVDVYMGTGGAPEGVLAAAALACIGGQFQGRLIFRNEDEKERARRIGLTDFDRKYDLKELASGDLMFAMTGVTDGWLLNGVRRRGSTASTHSLVMRSRSGTVRFVEAEHNFDIKTGFDIVDR